MFIKTEVMPCTQTLLMDQPLEADMISEFHTMPKLHKATQTLATHTFPLQAIAIATPIPNNYWLVVITSNLPKLKFIIFLEFYNLLGVIIY